MTAALKKKPAIQLLDILPGALYRPRTVARLFDVSTFCVRIWCAKGKLKAFQDRGGELCPVDPTLPKCAGDYFVIGAAIIRYAGAAMLEKDMRESTPLPPKPGDDVRRAKIQMRRLAKMQAGGAK